MAFEKSNFSRSVVVLMGAGTLILLVIIGTAIWLADSTARLGAEVIEARRLRTTASETLETLLNAETSQRGYLLTTSDRYLTPYQAALPALQRNLQALNALEAVDPATRPLLDHLKSVARQKVDELALTVSLARAGRREEALAIVRSDRGIIAMDDARRTLRSIIATAEGTVAGNIDRLNRNAFILQWITTVGGVVVILFGITAMFLVYRSILQAIGARREVEMLNQSLEDRVARRTEALTRANEEIQRFAYIVSHDLRAPLVNIMGFTSELEVGTKSLKDYFEPQNAETEAEAEPAARQAALDGIPEAVRFIRSSTGKMDRLINAILKLSREGRRELVSERVDLKTIFGTIAASLKHQIDETQTQVELSQHLPVLSSDRLALEQVFGNLFDNALKYLQPGRPGHIVVGAQNAPAFVTITIKDNGRGIADNDRERVFELFRRAGRQDRPGEGIGLAHVRTLVRRLGGRITCESTLGRGTTFTVSLPRRWRGNELRSAA
jgi:signal transduction histidine kinase